MSGRDRANLKRWRIERERGLRRLTDPDRAISHVNALRGTGASLPHIAAAAAVPHATLVHLLSRPHRILVRTETALLALTTDGLAAVQPNPKGWTSPVGARRRIQALLALGHTYADMEPWCPGARAVLSRQGPWITNAVHEQVKAAYAALSGKPGKSSRNRARAANAGYAVPACWDDDLLDDPAAEPWRPTPPRRGRGAPTSIDRDELVDEVEWLYECRTHPAVIAEQLRTNPLALTRRLHRAGRNDLARYIEREVA